MSASTEAYLGSPASGKTKNLRPQTKKIFFLLPRKTHGVEIAENVTPVRRESSVEPDFTEFGSTPDSHRSGATFSATSTPCAFRVRFAMFFFLL